MGKLKEIFSCAWKILALLITVVVLLVVLLGLYGRKLTADKGEMKALTCFVCEARKNYPEELTNKTGTKYSEDIDGCLNSPRFKKQCEAGEFCAVLHQKLNDIERVSRSCFTGGKLGCNTDIIHGIKEKACFCNSDLCMQIPFFYEDN